MNPFWCPPRRFPSRRCLRPALAAAWLAALLWGAPVNRLSLSAQEAEPARSFVGPTRCGECHPDILQSFLRRSGKARSMARVGRIRGLTGTEAKGCLKCHVTGFGMPGGYRSATETPDLHMVGCEVCHGPGSAHVERAGDPQAIVRLPPVKVCEGCHDPSRVEVVRFRGFVWKAH